MFKKTNNIIKSKFNLKKLTLYELIEEDFNKKLTGEISDEAKRFILNTLTLRLIEDMQEYNTIIAKMINEDKLDLQNITKYHPSVL